LQPMFEGFRYGWRARRGVRGDLLLGFGTGLLALNSQGLLEWTWRQTEVGYLFWMVAGIVAALSRQLRAAGTDSRRRPQHTRAGQEYVPRIRTRAPRASSSEPY